MTLSLRNMIQMWKYRRRSKFCYLVPLVVLLLLSLVLIYRINRSKWNKSNAFDSTEDKVVFEALKSVRNHAGNENIHILSLRDQNSKRKEQTESEEYDAYEEKGEKNSQNNSLSAVGSDYKAVAFSAQHVKSGGELMKRLPQAIIIGVKKGGTRALLEFLRVNPRIRAVGPETHYFDRNFDKGTDWYRDLMPRTYSNQITLEKTPSYFVTPEVPSLMHSYSKEVKLLVVVRDPVVRAISDFTQTSSKKGEEFGGHHRHFAHMALTNGSEVNTEWGAIQIGLYATHFQRWLHYFPLSSFYFVNGNQLIMDPAQTMPPVEAFLGLEPAIQAENFYFNETKGFPCLRKVVDNGQDVSHCLGKSKGRAHPTISTAVLRKLYQFFEPHNRRFYEMTGIDFGWEKAMPANQ